MADERQVVLLKLPPDQMKRLVKACEHLGQTRQAFVQSAVLAELVEVEEKRRAKKHRSSNFISGGHNSDEPAPTPIIPAGLGIASVTAKEREEETAPAPTTAAPVIVNVGTAALGGDVVERLAAYIAAGNQFERDSRMRTAVGVLHASATTDEERRTLADRLDAAVKAKLQTKNESVGAPVVRAARFAYDKIANLFGSDE